MRGRHLVNVPRNDGNFAPAAGRMGKANITEVELDDVCDVMMLKDKHNRSFPSSKESHFQSEVKCEAIDMKMIFNCHGNKTHFHNKGFALSLVLKVRFFGTRK